MQIIRKTTGGYERTETQEYSPTPAERFYWYGGTHAGLDPDNPYALKRTRVTKIRMKLS